MNLYLTDRDRERARRASAEVQRLRHQLAREQHDEFDWDRAVAGLRRIFTDLYPEEDQW